MTRAFALLALVAVAANAAFLPTTERAFETADFKGTFTNKVRQDDGCPNKIIIARKSGQVLANSDITVNGVKCNANGNTDIFDATDSSKVDNAVNGFPGPSKEFATVLADKAKALAGTMVGVTSQELTCGQAKLAKGTMMVFFKSEKVEMLGAAGIRFPAGNRVLAFAQPGVAAFCQYDAKPRDPPPAAKPVPVPVPANPPATPAGPSPAPADGQTPPTGGAASPTPTPETGAGAGAGEVGGEGSPDTSLEPSPTPTAESTGGGASVCFPSSATVELADGSFKRMGDVEIGDRVRVGGGKFSDVFMFTHKLDKVAHSFVKVDTASGHSLQLTEGHYLKVNGAMAAARTVVVGDSLELADGSVSNVAGVSNVQNVGLFNPQTVEGSIVVDGVVASTYTTAVEMKTAHSMLAPLRAVYNFFGLSMAALESGADCVAPMLPKGNAVY